MRAPSSFHSTAAGPSLGQRGLDVVAGRGEHRLDRAADLEPDRAQRLARPRRAPTAATAPRSPLSIARAADGVDAAPRPRARRRSTITPSERALAQLAEEQRDAGTRCSGSVARAKSAPSAVAPRGLRAAARPARRSRSHAASTSATVERRLVGRRGQVAQRAPSRRRSGAGAARPRGTRRPPAPRRDRSPAAHPPPPAPWPSGNGSRPPWRRPRRVRRAASPHRLASGLEGTWRPTVESRHRL